MADEPAPKRQRREKLGRSRADLSPAQPWLNGGFEALSTAAVDQIETNSTSTKPLTLPISPPIKKRALPDVADNPAMATAPIDGSKQPDFEPSPPRSFASPVQLSYVEGLPPEQNIDTVSLRDVVGDPLIKECWVFNYLFDVEFLLSNMDEDVREQIQIVLVHGSWKKEDQNRINIDNASKRYKNLKAITAYMPEAFGTHHSKMIVLIRHDDCAQVNIMTANILSRDWKMCQAVWRSPLLPFKDQADEQVKPLTQLPPLGQGRRFELDLLAYLRGYGSKLRNLLEQLDTYSFEGVRAALVASIPIRQNLRSCDPEHETMWGWPGLKQILSVISTRPSQRPHIVIQVSSVASLGAKDDWLQRTFLHTLQTSKPPVGSRAPAPKFSLIFPVADEIRQCVDGYNSGGSIHMKTKSIPQSKQLSYIRPMLCHWAGDGGTAESSTSSVLQADLREAGRRRAAPHIKTYIRFGDEIFSNIEWAMVTSANLSTQAWGAAANSVGEVRICSYELGVVIWPALWGEGAEMLPIFKQDMPLLEKEIQPEGAMGPKIGLRMAYDLPLSPYATDEMPWCATDSDHKPDWMGRIWPGCGDR